MALPPGLVRPLAGRKGETPSLTVGCRPAGRGVPSSRRFASTIRRPSSLGRPPRLRPEGGERPSGIRAMSAAPKRRRRSDRRWASALPRPRGPIRSLPPGNPQVARSKRSSRFRARSAPLSSDSPGGNVTTTSERESVEARGKQGHAQRRRIPLFRPATTSGRVRPGTTGTTRSSLVASGPVPRPITRGLWGSTGRCCQYRHGRRRYRRSMTTRSKRTGPSFEQFSRRPHP